MLDPNVIMAMSLGLIALCQFVRTFRRLGSGVELKAVTHQVSVAAKDPDKWILETTKKIDLAMNEKQLLANKQWLTRIRNLDHHLQSFHPMSDWTSAQFVDYVARVRDEVRALTHVVDQGVVS